MLNLFLVVKTTQFFQLDQTIVRWIGVCYGCDASGVYQYRGVSPAPESTVCVWPGSKYGCPVSLRPVAIPYPTHQWPMGRVLLIQLSNGRNLLRSPTSSHQAPGRVGAMMGCEAACWARERREEDCYYQSEAYSYWPHNWDTQLPGQSPLYNRNNPVKGGENHCNNINFLNILISPFLTIFNFNSKQRKTHFISSSWKGA